MIEVRDLSRVYPAAGGSPFAAPVFVNAVNGVSVQIPESSVLSIVGESGCGKTTLGRILAGLMPPTKGTFLIDGQDPSKLRGRDRDELMKTVQYIHQDPYSALNPNRTIWQTMGPIIRRHRVAPRGGERRRAEELLEQVGLSPDDVLDRFPHQLSGGQRQRAVLARALIVNPRYLVTDEAVSMIDVSLRVGILDLLRRLVSQGIGLVFITHDFAVARYVARDGHFVVMYLGRVIEEGETDDIILHPAHPYTRMLLSAVPEPDPNLRTRERLLPKSYDVPSPVNLPPGCAFASRCPFAVDACLKAAPELARRPGASHPVACILPGEVAPAQSLAGVAEPEN
jgi:oligopeptide/dipeptide ABC transporter ATP-binding protein